MQKLVFYNKNHESLEVGYGKPFILQNLVGLSDAPTNLVATRGYKQDGQTPVDQYLEPRVVSFTTLVNGISLQEVFSIRRSLIKFLNPKEQFEVWYYNDFLSVMFNARIESAPSFLSTQDSPGGNQQTAMTSLICDDPYLYDINESVKELALITPTFSFPMRLSNIGAPVSTLSNKIVTIINEGDVETPVRIHFIGNASNPSISNLSTGQSIRLVKEIIGGEILEITTRYGDKKVEIIKSDGSRENAFHYIDQPSQFFQLAVGENKVSYTADVGAEDATVNIFYKNRYVGV